MVTTTRIDSARRLPMLRPSTFRRALPGIGTTAVAVLSAAVLTLSTAPDAAARVTGLNVGPGSPAMSVGASQYGTNCTYTLTAAVDDYHPVVFNDSTGAGTFFPSDTINPSFDIHTLKGEAIVSWTPTQPGWHHIYANQPPYAGPAVSLLVGNGINTGSACLVLP
ncbi:hypothetical protein ABZ942_05225 [Nocardia sp. NPDC046473]|uniref:hypothetical protein n=1 Tax=Nocardia sp. NPDC046473 TaxID=3155733 RepID=UPI0033FD448C